MSEPDKPELTIEALKAAIKVYTAQRERCFPPDGHLRLTIRGWERYNELKRVYEVCA